MPDIIISEKTQTVLKRMRTPKITITNPENSDRIVSFVNAEATYLDGVYQGEVTVSEFSKPITMVTAMDSIQYINPITQQQETITVAQLASAIEAGYVKWYLEWKQQENNKVIEQ